MLLVSNRQLLYEYIVEISNSIQYSQRLQYASKVTIAPEQRWAVALEQHGCFLQFIHCRRAFQFYTTTLCTNFIKL